MIRKFGPISQVGDFRSITFLCYIIIGQVTTSKTTVFIEVIICFQFLPLMVSSLAYNKLAS